MIFCTPKQNFCHFTSTSTSTRHLQSNDWKTIMLGTAHFLGGRIFFLVPRKRFILILGFFPWRCVPAGDQKVSSAWINAFAIALTMSGARTPVFFQRFAKQIYDKIKLRLYKPSGVWFVLRHNLSASEIRRRAELDHRGIPCACTKRMVKDFSNVKCGDFASASLWTIKFCSRNPQTNALCTAADCLRPRSSAKVRGGHLSLRRFIAYAIISVGYILLKTTSRSALKTADRMGKAKGRGWRWEIGKSVSRFPLCMPPIRPV